MARIKKSNNFRSRTKSNPVENYRDLVNRLTLCKPRSCQRIASPAVAFGLATACECTGIRQRYGRSTLDLPSTLFLHQHNGAKVLRFPIGFCFESEGLFKMAIGSATQRVKFANHGEMGKHTILVLPAAHIGRQIVLGDGE